MRIFLCGDTHGDYDTRKLNSKHFIEGKDLTKDDFVIICGDACLTWNDKFDPYIQKWYNEKPWTTLFVDGNHENFDRLYSYPVVDFHGGKAHQLSSSIFHLMRGEIFDFNNQKFFVMGGAHSVDKMYRKEGISWWPQEVPTQEEFNHGLDNLEKVNYHIDYVLSHEVSNSIIDGWHYDHDEITCYFEVIDAMCKPKIHFAGHHHIDAKINETLIMYHNVYELLTDGTLRFVNDDKLQAGENQLPPRLIQKNI